MENEFVLRVWGVECDDLYESFEAAQAAAETHRMIEAAELLISTSEHLKGGAE